jgi:hypothetical protein
MKNCSVGRKGKGASASAKRRGKQPRKADGVLRECDSLGATAITILVFLDQPHLYIVMVVSISI